MAWGRATPKTRVSELERLAGQAEAAFLAMPQADQEAAVATVDTIARAVAGLKNVPDALVDLLGRIVIKFLIELYVVPIRKTPPAKLVRQVLDGAPRLLGPHRARIEELTGAAAATE